MRNILYKITFFLIFLLGILHAETVRVATYNVQDFYDLRKDGSEPYLYIPNGNGNWNKGTYNTKLKNITDVINDIKPDIIALQEVESKRVLNDIKKKTSFKYSTISDNDNSTTQIALLSNYKILATKYLEVSNGLHFQDILEVHINIKGSRLIIFVAKWHDKRYPETYRRQYAQALKWRLDDLGNKQDFIIIGDLNSNYNEYQTFVKNKKLNDTYGITGINHILKSIRDGKLINREFAIHAKSNEYLYNLWLELPKDRYSTIYKNKEVSHDNMILSPALFDNGGINYIDRSFTVYKKENVFDTKTKSIKEWEVVKNKSTAKGYSDHLALYADFDFLPFAIKVEEIDTRIFTSIDNLYSVNVGQSNYLIKNVVAILQDEDGTILKEPNGRAIYVYGHNDKFKVGYKYEVDVTMVEYHYGLRAIKDVGLVVNRGKVKSIEIYKVHNTNKDFNSLVYQNEVIASIEGIYNKGYLEYSGERIKEKIKIDFKDLSKKPKDGTKIVLKDVVVGFYKQPQLIVQ
jgi:endonuclease/exonuclease/phosphatase family metal-dependent hydrolase